MYAHHSRLCLVYKQLGKTKRVWWHGVHVRDEERGGEREGESVCTRTPERESKSMHGQLDTDPSLNNQDFCAGTQHLPRLPLRVSHSPGGAVCLGELVPALWLI
jgi:hypothetical protein